MDWSKTEEIRTCLSLCGCRDDDILQFIAVVQAGTRQEQQCWLRRQRKLLIEQIHEIQCHVDRIDYMIRSIEK